MSFNTFLSKSNSSISNSRISMAHVNQYNNDVFEDGDEFIKGPNNYESRLKYSPSIIDNSLTIYDNHIWYYFYYCLYFYFVNTNITHIKLGYEFNSQLHYYLPSSLKYLRCERKFNRPIDDLPQSLKILEIDGDFNQSIDNLPHSLKILDIRNKFCYPINNLPNSIEILRIHGDFNQSIDYLPSSLKVLEIHGDFNQPINNLPSTLKVLNIKGCFNQPIDNLPDSITVLNISGCFNQPIRKLPKHLKELKINRIFKESHKSSNLYNSFNSYNLYDWKIIYKHSSLVKLSVDLRFNEPIELLPKSIEKINIYFLRPIYRIVDKEYAYKISKNQLNIILQNYNYAKNNYIMNYSTKYFYECYDFIDPYFYYEDEKCNNIIFYECVYCEMTIKK